MRQILVAVSGAEVKSQVLDLACFFARFTDAVLMGMMMDTVENLKEIQPASLAVHQGDNGSELELASKEELFLRNRQCMSEACSNRGVELDFLTDQGVGLDDLIKESRFSDLIIVDPTISFERTFEGIPTVFLQHLLERTECPVIVAPESFDAIDEIIFAYDGGRSSMFAIRQFTQLFPELLNRKLTVLEVSDETDRMFTEKERLHLWLENYYTYINYELLYGRPKDELFGYLLGKERKIVVMGAFGRTMLSTLMSKSNARLILQAVNLPVFISHA